MAAGPGQLLGPGGADQPGQPLRAAGAGEHAELHLGHAEAGVLRRQPQVAGQRRFQASAEGHAGHGGDHRPGKGLQPVVGPAEVAQQAVGLGPDLADLGPGGEGLLRPREDDGLQVGVGGQRLDVVGQLGQELGGEGVEGRPVEPDELDAVALPFGDDVLGHGRGGYESVSDSSESAAV